MSVRSWAVTSLLPWMRSLSRIRLAGGPLTTALAILLVSTGAMLLVRDHLGILNVALLYLLVCLCVALAAGQTLAIVIALLSFLAFDFFFIPPYYTFTIAQSDHVLALFVYLGVATVTAKLVAQVRQRTRQAEREQHRAELLYELNAALISDVTLDAILATIVERVVSIYRASACLILLPDEQDILRVRTCFPPSTCGTADLDRDMAAVASWVITHRRPAALGTRRVRLPHGVHTNPEHVRLLRQEDCLFLPIGTEDRAIGVLAVRGRPGGGRFNADDEQLLLSFAHQVALALERARLTEEAARAAALAESDAIKSALLAAVSHDLRTPLATIKMAATSLLDRSIPWSESQQADLLRAIDEETDRLTLLISNLLDLSRIEGGVLQPDLDWYDVAELLNDVAGRFSERAHRSGHQLQIDVEPDLPSIRFDYVKIAQVIANIVENALKYTPPGTCITLAAGRLPGAIELRVTDTGPGISPKDLPHLFEKFYRSATSARTPGSGLGLTIAKGLVEAHGGSIAIESHPGQGTTVRVALPLAEAPAKQAA